jgi:PRC-barrel domain
MLRPFSHIKNFALAARDGQIGKVKELYFDDQSWIVRYVVVDTGGWLTGRKVLLSPSSFGTIADESKLIAVHLTKERIENSPPIDADKPVSRQHEEEWHRYYGYPGYWLVPEAIAFGAVPIVTCVQAQAGVGEARRANGSEERGDPHLRSTSEVTDYAIHATDGEIGKVDDFIIDDEVWAIRYVVILRSWWAGKKVILSPEWIERVSWEEWEVFVPLSRETIKNAPNWDESHPISRTFEQRLFDYYGRCAYWPIEV